MRNPYADRPEPLHALLSALSLAALAVACCWGAMGFPGLI